MDYIKLVKELDIVNKKMEFALKQNPLLKYSNYQIEIFPQIWDNSTGYKEDIGKNTEIVQTTYVLYNVHSLGGNAYVFFDGIFAYKTEINDKFMEDLSTKSMAGLKSYWSRYDMETYKNNPNEYPYYNGELI